MQGLSHSSMVQYSRSLVEPHNLKPTCSLCLGKTIGKCSLISSLKLSGSEPGHIWHHTDELVELMVTESTITLVPIYIIAM